MCLRIILFLICRVVIDNKSCSDATVIQVRLQISLTARIYLS